MPPRRVISVQSFVARGCVGNRAASLSLQLLGHEVDVVNTVEFSNHTGYQQWGGTTLTAAHLQSIFDAFELNGFFDHSHMLTGYVPGAEALQVVAAVVDKMRAINVDLIYLCDPVMGDEGHLYVSKDVVPVYKALLPKATIATPNDYETELLTDVRIDSLASLRRALCAFHDQYRLPHVIVSSCTVPASELDVLTPPPPGAGARLICAGSSLATDTAAPTQWVIAFPSYSEHFEGVGDVFSALVLAHFDPSAPSSSAPSALATAAERAIASLQSILARTRRAALDAVSGNSQQLIGRTDEPRSERVDRLRRLELRLVESRHDIMVPEVIYHARAI